MSLDTLLPKLEHSGDPLSAKDLTGLSGISPEQLQQFLETWRRLSIDRRRGVIDRLADMDEDNVELNFSAIFLSGLFDDDVQVRSDSIKALWEYEGNDLVQVLIKLLRDPEAIVRSEAALGLGRFLLRSELTDPPEGRSDEIEVALRAVLHDDAELAEVRGRAIEALGCMGADWVHDMIEEAYEGSNRRLQISAVHAMGRSADAAWLPTILEEMESDDDEMRFEAALAAGSIGDESAVRSLALLTVDDDAEVQEAAIGALGEIGGPTARAVLHHVASESSDERVLEAVSDALSAADFIEDPLGVKMHLDRSVADDLEDEDEE